jgi:hypothetical protein
MVEMKGESNKKPIKITGNILMHIFAEYEFSL